ncbi:MAG TPA: PP2C family protein-serine/threonine phosphatase [Thermoanaerobaculia bacterium]
MRSARAVLLWLLLGFAGAALLLWAYPRAFAFLPRHWQIDRRQAIAIALERLRELGPPVEHPYVVARFDTNTLLERRLLLAGRAGQAEAVRRSGLASRVLGWEVTVYPPDALREQWTYQAEVGLDGRISELSLRLDPQDAGRPIAPPAARAQADAFLARQGIDLSRYGEPTPRSVQLTNRTDLVLRYADRRPTPGGGRHGVEVAFAGDRLAGFEPWWDDPQQRGLQRVVQQAAFEGVGSVIVTYLAVLLLAVPFLRRYHEGEIGVRRGVQLFCLVLAAGTVSLLLMARAIAQGAGFGFATRQQTTWMVVIFLAIFNVGPTALLALFAWSVGESTLRERWGGKLAAFDALFQGDWANATVARASLRGAVAGICLAGGLIAATVPLARFGAFPMITAVLGGTESSLLPGFELLAGALTAGLATLLTAALCVIPLAFRRLGRPAGAVVSILATAVLLVSPYYPLPLPLGWGFTLALAVAAAILFLFLRYDLLTVLLAGTLAPLLLAAFPLLLSASPRIAAQGWIAAALALAPLLLSLRHLGSDREFVYRYEDIPPHVRRIAERERQRVELETARGIQSSILPDLPPRLAGVELSHAYLPATEVGGDFYDVLALEDGRLAVAVGDVAGHGVSSGLVMSMAKSALAVQVTFDPDVQAVFSTLNRMVYQTARKRLLTTLCYLLLDPVERDLLYASAGHLFPYVISPRGAVHALESIAYPLGVRGELTVEARHARLEAGDTLFLFSDGLVEARNVPSVGGGRDGEEFGFPRLEASLARHAGKSVEGLRDGVLADVQRFTGNGPREDDQTILVLRLAS